MSNATNNLDDLVDIFNKMENASPELRVIFGFPATGDLLPPDEIKYTASRNMAISRVRQAIREMNPSFDAMKHCRR